MSAFTQSVILQVGINVLLAVGYWIAVSTGRYSFGHVGFVAIGAYTSSILTENFSWPLPVALLGAAAAATVGGVLVGFMALRLPMLYLAIITLVFSVGHRHLAKSGTTSAGAIGMFGMDGTSIPMVLVCLAIVVVYLLLLSRSRLGLAYSAIREDDQAAMSIRHPGDEGGRQRVRDVGRGDGSRGRPGRTPARCHPARRSSVRRPRCW